MSSLEAEGGGQGDALDDGCLIGADVSESNDDNKTQLEPDVSEPKNDNKRQPEQDVSKSGEDQPSSCDLSNKISGNVVINGASLIICGEESSGGNKRVLRSDAAKKRCVSGEEGVLVEKTMVLTSGTVTKEKEDGGANNKRMTRSCVAKMKEDAGTNKRRVTISGEIQSFHIELMKCEEDSKIGERRITRSAIAMKRKEEMELELATKGCSKSSDKDGDGPSKKKMRSNSKKIDAVETEMVKRSGKGILKDIAAHSVGDKRENFGVTPQKGVGMLRLRGIMVPLSRDKKTGRFQSIKKGDGESRETLRHPTNAKDSSQARSRHERRKNLKKSSSTMGKCLLIMEKTSPAEQITSHKRKRGLKTKKMEFTDDKNQVTVKEQSSHASKTPLSTREIEEAARIERRIAKQKLKDQIKEMLLNAGWKIDLRPRNGKSYDDSVYISPRGHSYWSITKAYDVFQSQLNHANVGSAKNSSKWSNRRSRKDFQFSAIPEEALSILKKVIVNRRRSKVEMEEAKKKLGDGNTCKKAKGTASIKHPKGNKVKGRKFKERIKRSNIVDSIDRGIVGYKRKRDRKRQKGIALLARGSNQQMKAGTDVYVPYLFRRTILSWMIDLGIMPASGKVKYMSRNRPQAMMEGWITRNGIHCSCCSRIVTVSMFEVHAGSDLCQPYQNVYLEESTISLLQCQLNAWEKQDESVRQSFYSVGTDCDDPNDDTCGICGDGGDLICCDGCPSTFHLSCLSIQMLPPGDWHCTNCSCRFCGLVTPVTNPDPQENGLTGSSLLSCSQCEEKYHQKCVPEGDAVLICSTTPYISFCGEKCKKLFEELQKLLGVKNDLEAGFTLTLLQRLDEDFPESVCGLDQRVECNSKIAVALAVMDECFVPIIDQRSGINLIHNVVYNCGSNFIRLNYRGFYTFILERDDEIISAASLRIHGTRLAEMPFIGTRNMYRRQGMCRRLLNGIESALCSLNVEKLIIPAISELMDTWTNVFGFKPIEVSQREELKSINLLVFPGTGLLLKLLQEKNCSIQCKTADGVGESEPVHKHCPTPEIANKSTVIESNASDEISSQCEHKAKGIDADSSVESLDSCDSPHGLEPQALRSNPSIDDNNQCLLHPKVTYHSESVVDKPLQVASSFGPETKLLSEGTAKASEVIKTSLDVALRKEPYASCVSSASCGGVSSASCGGGILFFSPVHSVNHHKPRENLSHAKVVSADELHQNNGDLVKSLNVSSLPSLSVSFNGAYKHNTRRANDDVGYVEKSFSAVNGSLI